MKRFFKNLTLSFALYSLCILGVAAYGVQCCPDEFSVASEDGPALEGIYTLTDIRNNSGVLASTGTAAQGEYTARIEALGIVPVKEVKVNVSRRKYVNLGGDVIGIKMYTEGVIVVSVDEVTTIQGNVTPGTGAGLREGDIITAVNGETLESSDALAKLIEGSNGKSLALKVVRGTKEYDMTLNPAVNARGEYKAGIWVRDSSAGVGTITFTQPETGAFAALGHPVCDVDTGELMPLSQGEAVEAGIKGVYKGSASGPGELCGVFTGRAVGRLVLNSPTGIYGSFTDESYFAGEKIAVALADEVKTGAAQIIATVDSDGPQYYDIEITRLYSSSDTANRNMIIRVTDEELLSKTGGIVQGMSGSPIIQNSMLTGAVTHVFVNDPSMGYGVFAENMLNNAA